MPRKKTEKESSLGGLWEMILELFKSVSSIEERAERSLEKYKRACQAWLVKTAVMGLSVFMSLAFLVLGLFFILIDDCGVPRGVVFICGGLLGLLVLKLMVPSKK